MNQTDINEIILHATRELPASQALAQSATFAVLPLSVWLYIQELPPKLHLIAMQSAYIGFLAGKGAAREQIMQAFLKSAGFEHVVITAESEDVH